MFKFFTPAAPDHFDSRSNLISARLCKFLLKVSRTLHLFVKRSNGNIKYCYLFLLKLLCRKVPELA